MTIKLREGSPLTRLARWNESWSKDDGEQAEVSDTFGRWAIETGHFEVLEPGRRRVDRKKKSEEVIDARV